jgi:flagellar basal-body rod protein FlgF
MLKGMSIAAAAMRNQSLRQDVLANNLANVNTEGFKKEISFFTRQSGSDGQSETGLRVATSFKQGPLTRTQRQLDVAIQGEGFFVIETGNGERYTRRGVFVRSSDGYMVTPEGDQLVSSGGELQLPPGEVTISSEGIVEVDNREIGRIKVVRFDDSSVLQKVGSSMFKAAATVSPTELEIEEISMVQGFVEESNVNVIHEMSEMIKALKAYEISQKAIKSHQEVIQMVTSQVGRVDS